MDPTVLNPSESSPFRTRFHPFDAIRAASLLVVLEHSAVSYMTSPMPGLLWGVHDLSASRGVDWVFWMAQLTAVPLFFFTGGFFAARLYLSRGPRAFLLHRSRTLLGPLLLGGLILLPLTFYAWAYGWLVSGRCTVREILAVRFKPEIQGEVYGFAHLWFLQYLFLMCVAFCGVQYLKTLHTNSGGGCWAAPRFRAPSCGLLGPASPVAGSPKSLVTGHGDNAGPSSENNWHLSPSRRLLLALPVGLIVALNPGVAIDFHNSFFPDPWRLAYYSIFFIAGLALYRVRDALWRFVRFSGVFLALSVVPFLGVCRLLGSYTAANLPASARWLLAMYIALFVSLFLFGFLGLCIRFFSSPYTAVRYLADASPWIYLCHLPIVGWMQSVLYPTPLPAPLKFVLVFAAAMAFCLLTYHWMVRHRRWGALVDTTPVFARSSP